MSMLPPGFDAAQARRLAGTSIARADRRRSRAGRRFRRCASARCTPTSRASATTARRSRRCSRWPRPRASPAPCAALFDGETVNRTEGRAGAAHRLARRCLGKARSPAKRARDRRWRRASACVALVEALRGIRRHRRRQRRHRRFRPRPAAGGGRAAAMSATAASACISSPTSTRSAAQRLLRQLDPARTAVIAGVQDLRHAGNPAQRRASCATGSATIAPVRGQRQAVDKAAAFGVSPERILPMWDWVGGRYSLWSAVGFALALAIGDGPLRRACSPAPRRWTRTCATRRCAATSPRGMRWPAVWNRNGLGLDTQAVLPYDDRLALLPAYLQQLVMESLGKSVRQDGTPVAGRDGAGVCGAAPGTEQPAQLLPGAAPGHATACPAISSAWRGRRTHARAATTPCCRTCSRRARRWPTASPPTIRRRPIRATGPRTLLLLDELTPARFGMLIALYEHSVYVQSVVWGINAFDQWGVELGKQIATRLLPAVQGSATAVGDAALDPVTRALLGGDRACAARCRSRSRGPPASRGPQPRLNLRRCPSHRVLRQRPFDVLAHQRRGIVAARCQRGEHLRRASAHCPARPRCCAASARGRCGGSPSLRCAAGTRLRPTRTTRPASRVSRSLRARKSGSSVRLRELVPGADQLAVVAAEDAVADQRRAAPRGSRLRVRWSGS